MDKGIEALTPVCVPKRIVRNWAASVMRHCDYCSHYKDTVLNDDGSAICASCCDSERSGNMQCALEEALQRNGELIAALERAHQESKEQSARIEELESQRQLAFMACNRWREKCADAEKRTAELEAAPNGMMQLSNELAEMKRKQKPAYDVTEFGQFSAWGMGGELRTAITLFRFDGNPANRKGEMVPKFMLQGIINSLQEHCDKMGDESLVEIMVGAGGTVEGGE